MGHTVKLSLYDVAGGHYTAISSCVDTSSSGYLVSKEMVTTMADPAGEHVVEQMTIWVVGSNIADLRTKLAAIFDFCDQVRRFERGENTQFGRISIQPGGSGNVFVSRIYAIQAAVGSEILKEKWATAECEVTLVYERDGWWEDSTERAITMTVIGGGTATSANLVNLPAGNYVNLATTAIDGDVPAPINVEIENTYNTASGIQKVYIGGVAVSGSGVLPQLVYEGEVGNIGTPAVDATCSDAGLGTQKMQLTVGTTEALVTWWNVNDPEEYGGLWYKVLGRWAVTTNLGSVKLRWVMLSGSAVVWRGNQFMLANGTELLQEMGEIKMPPVTGWTGALSLGLYGISTTGSSVAVELDYIHLMASALSQKAAGYTPVEYSTFLDVRDGEQMSGLPVNNKILRDWYVMWQNQVLGYPGQYQRVALLLADESGDASIARTATVKMSYRPRYRSVGE